MDFVRRRVVPLVKAGAPVVSTPEDEAAVAALIAGTSGAPDSQDVELAVARAGCLLLDAERAGGKVVPQVDSLKRWCAARLHDRAYRKWAIFRFPETLDYWRLVDVQRPRPDLPECMAGPDDRLRRRDGFTLTDARMRPRDVLSEIHYCVLCHERDKDSCSKGLHERAGTIAVNPLGIELDGCPLDEHISEMHLLRKAGDAIGALALVTLNNPMCPGTGHRICNDCMKSCIYQKQEPVNIPQIETGVLTDVLQMPWGVEIYGLLTRWNPLNVRRPYALPYNGKNILVVGLGPAGYTLAHYLVNEGFGVVGIDGLKIEPLPERIVGTEQAPPAPIRDWSEIYRQLDERVLEGFGGVSEYGITVRWDKNFLTLLHLTLARRRGLKMYGGIRFGGTLTIDDAWALRLRSRRDCDRRRASDRDRHEEQPDPRDQESQRLPHGAAAHGSVQARRAAQPPGAPAGRRDRRRTHGHRHRDGADGVLPVAGREDAAALRGSGGGTRRGARPRPL